VTLVNTPLTFSGSLHPHHEEAVSWLLNHPKAVLADDVGLGKTPTALAHVADLSAQALLPYEVPGHLCRVLWLTDASLIEQTAAEVRKFLPGAEVVTGNDPALATGAKAQRLLAQAQVWGIDVLIVSHETAHSRREWLDRHRFSMLVVDEASKLKGGKGIYSTVRALARRADRVLSITATVLENDPTEMFRILHATDTPGLWPEHEFNADFVTWKPSSVTRWGKPVMKADTWTSPHHAEQVREYLGTCVLRRTAADVGLSLPRRVGEHERWVALTPEQAAAHEAAERDPSMRGFHAMQSAGLGMPLVDELIAELSCRGDEQAVVYTETLDMLSLVGQALDGAGIAHARIEGATAGEDRDAAVAAHRGGDVRVLLGSRVLERGLNLQHCRFLASVDSSWNPARENQRQGRICRIGSPHETYEHLVISPDTKLFRSKFKARDRKLDTARQVGLA
jgi:SNF2 family DNA or RNA helicase